MTPSAFLGGPHYPRIALARRLNKHAQPERGRRPPSLPVGRGVPQTLLGREGGKNSAHVAARTPTPPIAHNAPQRHLATKRRPRSTRHQSGGTPDLRAGGHLLAGCPWL